MAPVAFNPIAIFDERLEWISYEIEKFFNAL